MLLITSRDLGVAAHSALACRFRKNESEFCFLEFIPLREIHSSHIITNFLVPGIMISGTISPHPSG